MNWGKTLSWSVMALQTGACIGYFAHGDVKRGLYWMFCAALTGLYTI